MIYPQRSTTSYLSLIKIVWFFSILVFFLTLPSYVVSAGLIPKGSSEGISGGNSSGNPPSEKMRFTQTSFQVENGESEATLTLPKEVKPVAIERKSSKTKVSQAKVTSLRISQPPADGLRSRLGDKEAKVMQAPMADSRSEGSSPERPVLYNNLAYDVGGYDPRMMGQEVGVPDAGFFPIPVPQGGYVLEGAAGVGGGASSGTSSGNVARMGVAAENSRFSGPLTSQDLQPYGVGNNMGESISPKAVGANDRNLPVKRALPSGTKASGFVSSGIRDSNQGPEFGVGSLPQEARMSPTARELETPAFYSESEAQAWVDIMASNPSRGAVDPVDPNSPIVGKVW